MQRGEPLIYNGRIQADGLLGDPDPLRKEGEGYVAGDRRFLEDPTWCVMFGASTTVSRLCL